MNHIFYNSLDEKYKAPYGAVPSDTTLRIRLDVPEEYGYVDPHLVLHRDGQPEEHLRMDFVGQTPKVNHFSIQLPLDDVGLYFYHFDLYTDFRKIYCGEHGEGFLSWTGGREYQQTVYEKGFTTPEWVQGGTMYQIFPDRFFEGNPDKPWPFPERVYRANKKGEPHFWPTEQGGDLNQDYYGGDLVGVMEKLPYLANLGVTIIYFNPIFEAHSNHRYNTADYLKVDPLLGTNEDFELLCKKAKEYGIRIILDGVFSHTGSDSIYFNREGRYGKGGASRDYFSRYRQWYDFSENYACGYRSWWGFDTLPEVNEENPDYQHFICGEGGVIDTWLSRGASGFRLDVADELPDSFIEKIRIAVKKHGEDKLLVGEVWEDATTKEAYGVRRTYLLGKGLDTVMNYPFKNAALAFVKGEDLPTVADQILSVCNNYPAPALNALMNFMSTHDTERAITAIAGPSSEGHDRYWQSGRRLTPTQYEKGVKLLKLAYAMIFTLPGVPCVYYGDEIAMQGYRDPFNRAYYDWDSTEDRIRPVIRQLAAMRKEHEAFRDGRMELIRAKDDILQYRRVGKVESVEVILNRGSRLKSVKAFGKNVEVNPYGFTVVVDDNEKTDVGYFKVR